MSDLSAAENSETRPAPRSYELAERPPLPSCESLNLVLYFDPAFEPFRFIDRSSLLLEVLEHLVQSFPARLVVDDDKTPKQDQHRHSQSEDSQYHRRPVIALKPPADDPADALAARCTLAPAGASHAVFCDSA
eukprot:CAMPEP_0185312414 /NCGR_PEP_ID=MMETSP1363-20130426/31681_2 /TAXON_ID=38817 /ORGANISM="Gephyrocapsa oceanica, Strain RCC1303" /LENGTH=132 /DNA_ID=CAMNT_0027910229 /DNA_START=57 /DNA_END=455 /DNA_ORIENTATION=-